MTRKHLTVFAEVYRTCNITRASENLHMTQPAVSRSIKELEEYYGVRLFERMNHRIIRTAAGDRMYSYALRIIDTFDDMELYFKNDSSVTLKVGSSITIGNFYLPNLTKQFQTKQKDAALKIMISNGETLEKKLLENKLDIILIENEVHNPMLRSFKFAEDRLVLITPQEHPILSKKSIRLSDLVKYPLLMREQGSAVRSYLEQLFAVNHLSLEPVWESTSTHAIIRAVHFGIGISLLPEKMVMGSIEGGKVSTRTISDTDLSRQYYLVHQKEKYITEEMKTFEELCLGVTL
jgi:DNA-binding transcriptional LysR family regulator